MPRFVRRLDLSPRAIVRLRKIHRQRRLTFGFILTLPVLAVLSLVPWLEGMVPRVLGPILLLIVGFLLFDLRETDCPHCKKRLFQRCLMRNDFSDRCLHCGVLIDQDAA